MNPVNCKQLLLLLSLLVSLSTIFGQQAKDTIYFDEEFSVCERLWPNITVFVFWIRLIIYFTKERLKTTYRLKS
jgi:hypothetical protein